MSNQINCSKSGKKYKQNLQKLEHINKYIIFPQLKPKDSTSTLTNHSFKGLNRSKLSSNIYNKKLGLGRLLYLEESKKKG